MVPGYKKGLFCFCLNERQSENLFIVIPSNPQRLLFSSPGQPDPQELDLVLLHLLSLLATFEQMRPITVGNTLDCPLDEIEGGGKGKGRRRDRGRREMCDGVIEKGSTREREKERERE